MIMLSAVLELVEVSLTQLVTLVMLVVSLAMSLAHIFASRLIFFGNGLVAYLDVRLNTWRSLQ